MITPRNAEAVASLWEAARQTGAVVTPQVSCADYTTSQVGAPCWGLVACQNARQVSVVVREALRSDVPLTVLGGGSNLVMADESVGVKVHEVVLLHQQSELLYEVVWESENSVTVRVPAGLNWDVWVAETVRSGWGGVECLSGIPGQVGATPVQNVGAYGVEVQETVQRVEVVDRLTGAVEWEPVEHLDLSYRFSNLKFTNRAVVTAVEFRLRKDGLSAPLRYRELARQLGCTIGDRVPVAQVREAVLRVRRDKGMVVCGLGVRAAGFGRPPDTGVWQGKVPDPDTFSTGSFFTNPVVCESLFAAVVDRVRAAGCDPDIMPTFPGEGGVKLSAAWLIDQAGFVKGYPGEGAPARLSTRHTLALTNRGAATTRDLLQVATAVRDGVWERFGVELVPEPVLVECELPPLS